MAVRRGRSGRRKRALSGLPKPTRGIGKGKGRGRYNRTHKKGKKIGRFNATHRKGKKIGKFNRTHVAGVPGRKLRKKRGRKKRNTARGTFTRTRRSTTGGTSSRG